MSYQVHNFQTGDIIEAAPVNEMDRQIQLNEEFVSGHGAQAYAHGVTNKGSQFTAGFYKIETNGEGHVIDAVPVVKKDITDLGVPAQDTTYEDATQSVHGLMSTADKIKLDGISSEANKTSVQYDTTNKKFTQTTDGNTADVVGIQQIKSDLQLVKADVGLSNADNTSDADKPISTATQAALDHKLSDSLKGAASGLAELDASGKVPASQLPSYVDDVLEFDSILDFPAEGESGKIYVAKDTNLSYRWTGTTYIKVASDLSLGETSSTAYRGDRGAAAYAHAVTNKGLQFASGFYKIQTNAEGHVIGAIQITKEDITGLGIPAQDTTYSDATQSVHGLMSSSDKTKLDGIAQGATANIGTITKVQANGADVSESGTANIPAASKTAYGVTQLSSAVDSNSESLAATPKAVKEAYDLADGKVSCTTENVKTALGVTQMDQRFLREDGTWDTPPGAVYDNYPAEQGGTRKSMVLTGDKYNWDQKVSCTTANVKSALGTGAGTTKFLREDGTWQVPDNYDSLPAAQGGTDKSLVLTGDKYNWDQKPNRGTFTWGDLYQASAE